MSRPKEHLFEVDLLRAFIILGVLCVHFFSFFTLFTNPYSGTNTGMLATLTTFHFTREAFMFITGLVLFITYYFKPFQTTSFWMKRFKLIFIPYATWTAIYILFSGTYLRGFQWTFGYVAKSFLVSLTNGQQFYLYYLLISMQLYLLFPLFVWALKRLHQWHLYIFIGSFAVEILLMWWNQAVLQNLDVTHLPGWLHVLWQYRDRNIITYQFWFVTGALAAIHYQTLKPLFLKHTRWIYAATALATASLWANFAVDRLVLHRDQTMSALVLQPMMVPYSLCVTVLLWRVGVLWSTARTKPGLKKMTWFIEVASSASFGVFLIHPFVMHFIALFIYRTHPSYGLRMTYLPIAIVTTYIIAIVIARYIGKVPYLSYIVGQKAPLPSFMKLKPGVLQSVPRSSN